MELRFSKHNCVLVWPHGYRSIENLCSPVIMKKRTVAAIDYRVRDVSDKIQLRKKGDVNKSG